MNIVIFILIVTCGSASVGLAVLAVTNGFHILVALTSCIGVFYSGLRGVIMLIDAVDGAEEGFEL